MAADRNAHLQDDALSIDRTGHVVFRYTIFRPCIDLHQGKVKQIVGETLTLDDDEPVPVASGECEGNEKEDVLITNFTTNKPASYYAEMFKRDNLTGGHVIMLGAGNEEAAMTALTAWKNGLQVGGGLSIDNCEGWLWEKTIEGAEERPSALKPLASKIIVTSWLFPDGIFSLERVKGISAKVGKSKLVIDLSCRRIQDSSGNPQWMVAIDKWKKLSNLRVDLHTLTILSEYTDEFLIHAADVEGKCSGIDEDLVACLGNWLRVIAERRMGYPRERSTESRIISNANAVTGNTGSDSSTQQHDTGVGFRHSSLACNNDGRSCLAPLCTYAGGARHISDLQKVHDLSGGLVDVCIGSALDIFGGSCVKYLDCVAWNSQQTRKSLRDGWERHLAQEPSMRLL